VRIRLGSLRPRDRARVAELVRDGEVVDHIDLWIQPDQLVFPERQRDGKAEQDA